MTIALVPGKNFEIEIDDSGGTPVSARCYVSNVSLQKMARLLEATTGCSKQVALGVDESSIDVDGPWSPTSDSHLGAIWGGASRTVIYYPGGKTAGYPKYTLEAFFHDYNVASPATGNANYKAKFTPQDGTAARGTV